MDFSKMKKTAKESTKAETTGAAKGKVYPVYNLAYKEGKDSEELVNLTGLFERKTKKGDAFYSGFNKETEIGFTVFANKEDYVLKANAGKEKSEAVCTMKKMEKGYLFGKAEDGRMFFAFPVHEEGRLMGSGSILDRLPKPKAASPKRVELAPKRKHRFGGFLYYFEEIERLGLQGGMSKDWMKRMLED